MIYMSEKKEIIMENCQKILDHLENWELKNLNKVLHIVKSI